MKSAGSAAPGNQTQERPAAALVPSVLSLRARLTIFLVVATALIIGVSMWLETDLFERTVETELLNTTQLTALAIADDFELRPDPPGPEGLSNILHDFKREVPSLQRVSIIKVENGVQSVYASTSTADHPEDTAAVGAAINSSDPVWGAEKAAQRTVAVRALHDGRIFGAVAVTVSLDARDQVRRNGRTLALWSAAAAILLLIGVIDWGIRRLVHRPLYTIRQTMALVAGGTLKARAKVFQADELGKIAAGLNHMLGEMEDMHDSLQQRVQAATAELRSRNRELVETNQHLFKLRQELSRAEQMAAIGQTVSNVAHQIGTPLNLVSGYIQIIMEEEGPGSAVTRRLHIAQEQIQKVTAAVRGLLDRSRHAPRHEPIDAGVLVTKMCGLVEPALAVQGVRLELEIADALPPVAADAVQLELALLNLISNALDAMPAGGSLTVTVGPAGDGVRVEVADTGEGIAPELVGRIFEPWMTTKPEGRGTGLGLSITREVIAEHGGTISVRSEVGVGTAFTVELPAAETVRAGIQA
jgi:two-component system NtrC family sensor kinase